MPDALLLPILLPLAGGLLALVAGRHGIAWQRAVGLVTTLTLLPVAVALCAWANQGPPAVYAVGDWPAPYGITLVLDRLAAWMLLVTAVVAAGAVLFAVGRSDTGGRHFHSLFQFQLLGINGAFLTGDLFNLFVFFEVLLIASYALLAHGGGAARTAVAIRVAVLNLVGSVLFLVAVGCLYSAAGTLNLADLAARAATLPADRAGLWQAGGWLLLAVFALKAAVVPLGFWLPGAYGTADGAVAALFSVLTKVGIVSALRCCVLVFPDLGIGPVAALAAVATLALGSTGMLAARSLSQLAAHAVVLSVGVLLVPVALFTRDALAAATFYLAHGTFASAALFLVAARVAVVRGEAADRLVAGPAFRERAALPLAFLLTAVAVAGLPPLGGFLGKAAILAAAVADGGAGWAVPAVLTASLLAIVALAKAGTTLFWKTGQDHGEVIEIPGWRPLAAGGAGLLLSALVLLSLAAGPAFRLAGGVAGQVLDRQAYIEAVLGERAGGAP